MLKKSVIKSNNHLVIVIMSIIIRPLAYGGPYEITVVCLSACLSVCPFICQFVIFVRSLVFSDFLDNGR